MSETWKMFKALVSLLFALAMLAAIVGAAIAVGTSSYRWVVGWLS